jgi:hypothetical protein
MDLYTPFAEFAHRLDKALSLLAQVQHSRAAAAPKNAGFWQPPTPAALVRAVLRPNGAATVRLLGLHTLLEPALFVGGMLTLISLAALGLVSATFLLVAGGLMVAVLSQVFGIELGLQMPSAGQ